MMYLYLVCPPYMTINPYIIIAKVFGSVSFSCSLEILPTLGSLQLICHQMYCYPLLLIVCCQDSGQIQIYCHIIFQAVECSNHTKCSMLLMMLLKEKSQKNKPHQDENKVPSSAKVSTAKNIWYALITSFVNRYVIPIRLSFLLQYGQNFDRDLKVLCV